MICGKQAIDGDTAQVGPGIAAHLDWPQVTYVSHLRALENGDLTVTRMNEDGYDVAQLTLPAVISVVKDINTPRVPNLRSVLASRKAAIERWDAWTGRRGWSRRRRRPRAAVNPCASRGTPGSAPPGSSMNCANAQSCEGNWIW